MTKKEQFKSELDWYLNNWDWIVNGNYGEKYCNKYRIQYNRAIELPEKSKQRALRSIIIQSFTELVALELDCSYGHAQKIIVDTIGLDKLEKINEERIQELHELY